jgi:hypothetical protein
VLTGRNLGKGFLEVGGAVGGLAAELHLVVVEREVVREAQVEVLAL